jgi:L-ascorbate metabolism protein UlaG (beta-lactamase superfamily)
MTISGERTTMTMKRLLRTNRCSRALVALACLTVGIAAVPSAAPVKTRSDPNPAAAQLSDRMTLDEIEKAMAACPPSWEFGDPRAQIMSSLDRLITVQMGKSTKPEEKAKLKPIVDFYRRRVDRGLDKIEKTKVVSGVYVFKFYSSALVLKSADGTIAVDFCQGPVNNGGEPETRDGYGSGFYMTPPQRDRLAKLVDVSLITHRHHDHADYSLARRMAAQGKTIVGPAQLKKTWKGFADAITVPNYGTVQQFGPCEIFTMRGCQCSTNTLGDDGQRTGVSNPVRPDGDSESVVYLFRIGGIVFVQGAENHAPADAWLKKGIELGFKPNVRLSVGQYQGQRSVDAVLKGLKPCFVLPVHEYEMTHDNGGNRTGPLLRGNNRRAFDQKRAMPLLWGEDFLLTRPMIQFTE